MAKKKILLIAGHGRNVDGSYDPGACSIWGQEADYTRELATLVQQSIGTIADAVMYDQNKNCYSQSRNGNVPDYAAYDLTLEIHFNAKAKKDPYGDGTFTGIGGYIHPNNAGKTVARAIIDGGVALGFKEWLLDTSTGLLNLNNAQRQGAKYFLLETAFIDDGDDMNFYKAHKNQFAQAIAQAILKGLGVKASAGAVAEEKYWRVRLRWEDASSQRYAMESEAAAIRICPAGYSVYDPDGKCVYTNENAGMQAVSLKGCPEEEFIERVGPLYTDNEKKNGILACVPLAQSVLESGYGQTGLAQLGNNLHGMKCQLSGNVWAGTVWDGESYYEKQSPEYENGQMTMKTSRFRCYGSIEESIADHAAYLLNAPNGTKQRYAGLKGEKDYRRAISIIKKGGYATDPEYVSKICSIIEKWDLTRFNADKTGSPEGGSGGNTSGDIPTAAGVPYLIETTCNVLNIRSEATTESLINGTIMEDSSRKKKYTIVEEKAGQGSIKGWGRLKSGIGWVSLDFVRKV